MADVASGDVGQTSSSSSRFFPSYQVEQREIGQQLAEELESTLTSIPGIEKAHVHISLAPEGIWRNRNTAKSSASVVLTVAPSSKILTTDIATLVSSASVGLEKEQVRVFIYPTRAARATQSSSNQPQNDEKRFLVVITVLILLGALGVMGIGIRRMRRNNWKIRTKRFRSVVRDQVRVDPP